MNTKSMTWKPTAWTTEGVRTRLRFEVDVQQAPGGGRACRGAIWNRSDSPIRVDRVELFDADLKTDRLEVFRQGFYMPGDTAGFYTVRAGEPVPARIAYGGDPEDQYALLSEGLVCLRRPRTRKVELLGFTTGRRFHSFFLIRTRGRSVHLSVVSSFDGIRLDPGQKIPLEELLIAEGEDFASLLERYADRAGQVNGVRVRGQTVTGWTDWQYYRRNKTQEDVLRNAGLLKKLNDEGFGLQFVMVDAGYCPHSSEWLAPCEKFPDGMAALGKKLRRLGLRMGVWFAPYVSNVNTAVVREHPDWLVRDKQTARPIGGPTSCVGEYRVLDFSIPEAMQWMRGIVRTMVRDWGAEYIKLDGPNPTKYLGGRLRDERMTVTEMFRRTLEVIREECGRDVLVEGEGLYTPSMGLVDVQRVQQDTWAFWTRPDGRSAGLRENAKNDLLSSFLHGRVWSNQREDVILRDFPSPHHHMQQYLPGSKEVVMPEAERRLGISAAALAGGPLLLPDPLDELLRNPQQKMRISRMLPLLQTKGCRVIDAFTGREAPSLYYVPVHREFESWYVVGVFNWEDGYGDFRLPLAEFAGGGSWHAFDFWEQAYLGRHRGGMTVRDVPAHGCRLIALRRSRRDPQLIGTNMHLFQGAVELTEVSWTDDTLTVRVDHTPQAERSVTLWRPRTRKLLDLQTRARNVLVDDRDPNLLRVYFRSGRRATLRFTFSGR